MEQPPLTGRIAGDIRAEVTRRGARAIDLMEVIGRSKTSTYNKWNGHSAFSLAEIERIAEWIDMDVEILFTHKA